LGLIQGPAELLPVSSSGHLALVPRLLGWKHADLAPEARKTFEVALHAGSAPALCVAAGRRGLGDLRYLGLTMLPAAVIGKAFEGPIERRLGGTASVCAGQVAGGLTLLVADLAGERRNAANALDHLAVGFAQAAALMPGVSRSGAALTAGRLRGLSRRASLGLSLRAALPVTLAAGALKGARMARTPPAPGLGAPLAAGCVAALVSSMASLPLLTVLERRGVLRAVALYRIALGVTVLALARPTAEVE
jgi:undecaprenyl-diphosphatase